MIRDRGHFGAIPARLRLCSSGVAVGHVREVGVGVTMGSHVVHGRWISARTALNAILMSTRYLTSPPPSPSLPWTPDECPNPAGLCLTGRPGWEPVTDRGRLQIQGRSSSDWAEITGQDRAGGGGGGGGGRSASFTGGRGT